MEPIFLTCLFIIVLCVKYFKSDSVSCPQCYHPREEKGTPLCGHCGWMFESPGTDDEDYVPEEEEVL